MQTGSLACVGSYTTGERRALRYVVYTDIMFSNLGIINFVCFTTLIDRDIYCIRREFMRCHECFNYTRRGSGYCYAHYYCRIVMLDNYIR